MQEFKHIPPEILADIVSRLSNPKDLFNCILASRALEEAAKTALYFDIDLNFENSEEFEEDEEEISDVERQRKLLRAIAQNPHLGSLVRKFTNCRSWHGYGAKDATSSSNTEVLIGAAKNLKRLTEASFTMNHLATTIIDALPSYSNLSNLKIEDVSPEEHIWIKEPTSLMTLDWKMPISRGDPDSSLSPANILLKAVEITCPQLTSLGITLSQTGLRSEIPPVEPGSVQQYIDTATPDLPIMNLQHFSLKFEPHFYGVSGNLESRVLEFIERHRHTLKSVAIPIPCGQWTRGGLDFVLKVCKMLPNLRALTLNRIMYANPPGEGMTPHEFFQALTKYLTSSQTPIERFSVSSIECPFSAQIGKLFGEWKDLKFLHLGDLHSEEGEGFFRNDGRPDFENYNILGFIRQLPQSLEELYLEINAEGVCCDEDEDFDPFCYLGPRIFKALRRLHTCDLHAWISNIDGGLGQIPEKSVHYRRLPHKNGPEAERKDSRRKDVWTSRMDCVYQEDYVNVSKRRDVVELNDEEGEFCGKGAKEVWLDGFTSRELSDYSWPSYHDPVQTYPMFRKY